MSPIRLSSAERLLAAIRLKNPNYVFDMSDVEFGLPVVIDQETHFSARNTELHVTATVASTRYILDQDIYYNRNDLAVLFTGVEDIGTITETSTAAVIARINEMFGMSLRDDDITVTEFSEGGEFGGSIITVVALPNSLGYIGQVVFTVTVAKIPLYVAIANNILDGLEYPAIHIVEPEVVVPNVPLSEGAVNPVNPNNMLHGSGNSAAGFYSVNDGGIELAITARRWKSNTLQPYNDGVISIELLEDQDWSIATSIATVGELAGTRVTDSYDVYWTVTNIDTNEEMVWELRPSVINEGNTDWVCTTHSLPAQSGNTITDNSTDENDSVVQNFQRVSFYPNVFPETPRLPQIPNGCLGTFDISLGARIKDTLSTLQEVKLRVVVTAAEPV